MRARVLTLVSLVLLPSAALAQVGSAPIIVAPTVPPAFHLLDEPAVQKGVGLTDAQKAAAEQIRQSWPLAATGLRLGWFGHVPPDMMRAAINQRTADFLAKDLSKEQRTRLNQIVFQLREKEFGAHQAFAMAARDLGLRPDQLEDVHTLKALRVEEIAATVTSGKRFEKVKTEVQATNGDTFEKMAEMLTRVQRERMKEMRGKPFTGTVELTAPLPAAKTDRKAQQAYPPALFGVYDFEIRYLASGAIRSEIGITDDQMPAIRRELDDWEMEFGALNAKLFERVSEMHERSAKALDKLLAPGQRKRFDELMAQRRLSIGGREAVCGYPPVVAAIKLTPVQLKGLKEGKSVEDVLTKTDLASLEKVFGKSFEISPYVPDPLRPRAKDARAADGSSIPTVTPAIARDFLRLTDRLKLTAEQVKKLRDLAEDEPKVRELIQKELALDDTPPVAGAGRAMTAVNVVTEHYRAAVEQQCWDVLEPGQQSMARKIFGRAAK
jgi:hypothetical protein